MTQAELLRYLAEDVVGILRVSGPELDQAYIADWAARIGLTEVWEQIRKEAD